MRDELDAGIFEYLLGGQEEEVYEKTDKHRIARAFRTF